MRANPRSILLRVLLEPEEEARLAQAGLVISGAAVAALRAAATRVARHLAHRGARVVGFVPASPHVAVPPVLIHLGLALVELTGATVAVVDGNVRYPGLPTLAGPVGARSPTAEDSVFRTRWLGGSLALLSPPKVERAGDVLPQLSRALVEGAELFAHVLVDLTGFELLGEHAAAAALMDGVAVVALTHQTTEAQLLALQPLLPPDRFIGVMLLGD